MIGWKHRIRQLFAASDRPRPVEYDLRRIREKVRAPSNEELVAELTRSVAEGRLKVSYRIVSPYSRQGVKEFENVLEIPDEVYDPSTGQYFRADAENLDIIYRSAN